MCDICGGYFCYPSCPSYNGDSAEFGKRLFLCSRCGRSIYEIDDYTKDEDNVYCEECSQELENAVNDSD